MNDEAVFAFDLHESLYFESGQEVAEMKSISLDPEIAIQDYGDYVAIRGVIELQGEYVKHTPLTETDAEYDLSVQHSKRFVERVMDVEDGEATFMHRFPIEISIPTYRVTALDDVSVDIETFDYELPGPSHLKFTSKIAIYGIQDEREKEEDIVVDEGLSDHDDTSYELGEAFSVESHRAPDASETETDGQEDISPNTSQEGTHQDEASDYEAEVKEKGEESEEKEEESGRWKWKETQTLGEFFGADAPSETEEYEDSLTETYEEHEDSSEEFESYAQEEYAADSLTEEYTVDHSEEVPDVMYLSNMFREEEEEHYSKMRLCIVQPDDSIETIAQRYGINSDQIMSQNRLENEEVSPGQLLYIPYTKQNKA
ncbi:Stage VI sporulation protein D [Lentibacillus sp. JNUCC-1]|uniref:stage VI sporulation protein D n=1 Tax=Lentibacillus sp. JNUCC-1 TaxID=2654513 RepID=UPI0012E94B83|nr:stage VI sporulation protein D [Lentibacillus sp. JNUCC-1]MUV39419.1 Stage VI sporulation protein D [Lentibacillus sp. JNUCC-1]